MKIGIDACNLIHSLTGIGRYAFEMSRHLALLGNELILYLPEKPAYPLLQWPGTIIRIGNYPGSLWRAVWRQMKLPRLVVADGVDVFWGPAHRLPCYLDQHIPRVVTIHDLVWLHAAETMRLQTWFGERFLMKSAVKCADRIISVSNATAEALKAFFPDNADKIRVVYPGTTLLNDKPSGHLSEIYHIDRAYALFVGTLEPRKNLPNLLEAYARLPNKTQENILLVIAGGQGWHLGDLRQLISKLNIQPFVRLVGYISDNELAKLYRNARFLVMPSFYEGFGFPIIEAHAAGIPVLTSHSSSMPEVAGNAAVLVDPKDIQSIANGLQRLATDTILYEKLAHNASINAARFNWEKSAKELMNVFEEAVAMRRR